MTETRTEQIAELRDLDDPPRLLIAFLRLLNAWACKTGEHDYAEPLFVYPRPGPAPGNMRYRECARCGHIPNERIRDLLAKGDADD